VILDRRAYVFELSDIELEAFSTDDLSEHEGSYPIAESKTVGFGYPIDMIDGDDKPSAWHVLDDDCRMARDIFAHVPCNGPGVRVEAAARRGAHDDPYCLTFVEGRGCVSRTGQE
jgi:hypothetical protein